LGDRFGRRRTFIVGTIWFAGASGLCAVSPTIEFLVAARALQGVGGALLTPGSLAMIQASFLEQDRGKAIGAWSGFGGIATVLGLGLALLVAPLTTTVLAAAEAEHAGIASGINNAVARAAGLLAVALLPLLAGISGADYQRPVAFAAGFRIAMLVCAALLLAGGITAGLLIRNPRPDRIGREPVRRQFCALDGPPLQPTTGRETSRYPARVGPTRSM
jgi:MFS family permease